MITWPGLTSLKLFDPTIMFQSVIITPVVSHGQIKTHWTGALILSPFVSNVVSNLKIPQSTQNDVGASLPV